MSRKKIAENNKKSIKVSFRMDAELALFMTKRAEDMGLSMSEYLRMLAGKKPMVRLETKQNMQCIKYELSMIGTNLNQIAHALNGDYYHYPEDAKRAENVLKEFIKVLNKIRENY